MAAIPRSPVELPLPQARKARRYYRWALDGPRKLRETKLNAERMLTMFRACLIV